MLAPSKPTSTRKPVWPHKAILPGVFAHRNGQWAKKIKGKLHYLGKINDPATALTVGLDLIRQLADGDTPIKTAPASEVAQDEIVTIDEVCNRFYEDKQQEHLTDRGIKVKTLRAYRDQATNVCRFLKQVMRGNKPVSSITPNHFYQLLMLFRQNYGLYAVRDHVVMTRMIFSHAQDIELIDRLPKYGKKFKGPSQADFRRAKVKRSISQFFEAREIRSMLKLLDDIIIGTSSHLTKFNATVQKQTATQMKAMILLAINTGFGNTDVGLLPLSLINFKTKTVRYPREKTGMDRCNILWDETIAAIKAYLKVRPVPRCADAEDKLFVTRHGNTWVTETMVPNDHGELEPRVQDQVNPCFSRRVMKKLGLNGRRGFNTFRHTYATKAQELGDANAKARTMGHKLVGLDDIYVEGLELSQLKTVGDHVHKWLFGE